MTKVEQNVYDQLKESCGGMCLVDKDKCECFGEPSIDILDDLGISRDDWDIINNKSDCVMYDIAFNRVSKIVNARRDSLIELFVKSDNINMKPLEIKDFIDKHIDGSLTDFDIFAKAMFQCFNVIEERNIENPLKPKEKHDGWSRLRYEAFRKYGNKCKLCGRAPKDGVVLHIDHIKPKSKYPELSRDINNLQVLCEQCNVAKSNAYEDDWR